MLTTEGLTLSTMSAKLSGARPIGVMIVGASARWASVGSGATAPSAIRPAPSRSTVLMPGPDTARRATLATTFDCFDIFVGPFMADEVNGRALRYPKAGYMALSAA